MKRSLLKTFSVAFLALIVGVSANSQERDPFSPSSGATVKISSTKKIVENANVMEPLTASKIASYKIVGVITSDKKKLVAIKALDGSDYVVSVNSRLGSEGGVIKDISVEGIVLEVDGSEINLPVSNKVEVLKNESGK